MKKMYNISQMFDIANEKFNLKISKKNTKEIETIKRTIRRRLEKHGITKPPYEADENLKNQILFSDLNEYFLKKSAQANYFLLQDWEEKGPVTPPTYTEAVINVKLNFILELLGNLKGKDFYFKEPAFQKAYNDVLKKLNDQGRPQPGYNDALHALNGANDFFEIFGKFDKKKGTTD